MRIGILTVSDLGAVGQRADTSGDAILEWASGRGYDVVVRSVVPDETDRIAGKLARWADSGEVDVVLTTGGTGLTARDVTPEATEAVLDRPAAGRGVRRAAPPACCVGGGGVPKGGAARLLARARPRPISTLGLVEQTEPAAKGWARRLGLPPSLTKPADPAEVTATVRRLVER